MVCCAQKAGFTLLEFVALGGTSISALVLVDQMTNVIVHNALAALLTRHAQTLSHRASRSHTTLSATDDVAHTLKPELMAIFTTLQGLCLLDQSAKIELGQSWMLEVSSTPLS